MTINESDYLFTRKDWGPGPWDNEPDSYAFNAHGYPCILRRGPFGAWCGYVGVPLWHPAFFFSYSFFNEFEVHGGLTYGETKYKEPGKFHHCDASHDAVMPLKWFGFDCSHAWDLVPGLRALTRRIMVDDAFPQLDETYRNMSYATTQCIDLAKQLKDVTWLSILKKIPTQLPEIMRSKLYLLSLRHLGYASVELSPLNASWQLLKKQLSKLRSAIFLRQ